MGHYLGEMESDEEYRYRAIYGPMLKKLRVYDEEVERGLVHTDEWAEKMELYRHDLREKGYTA